MSKVEETVSLLEQLSLTEKIQIIERLAGMLRHDLDDTGGSRENKQPLNDLYGLCADLGTAPSDEDIAEVRREMMRNFPREDIT